MSRPTNYSNSAVVASVHQDGAAIGASLAAVCLSGRQLLVFVFFTMIFVAAARPITDPDFWWHLRTGQYLIETRTIPHTDIFSSLHFGHEWVPHEWLSEVFIYSIYRGLGYVGLIIAFSLLITISFVIVYRRYNQRVGHPYVGCVALLFGASATIPTWGVRPQMFSLFFASLFLAILENYSREGKGKQLYWLVPLTVLWVNMHAGFALGLVLILLTIVGLVLDGWLGSEESRITIWRQVRALCLILLICTVSVAINPNGLRLYSYPIETLKSQAMMKYISEWWSPNFHELMFQPFALLIFATLTFLALSPRRVRLRDLLLLSATGVAALRSGRNVPFFALVSIPLLAEHAWAWTISQRWGQWLTKPEQVEVGRHAVIKVGLNIILLVLLPLGLAAARVSKTASSQPAVSSQEFPSAAVDYIAARKLPQPLYNEYGWGGYLIWRLYPEYHVYIDGRADVYGDAFLEEFLMVHSGETRWQEPLDRNGVRTVLVKPDTAIASLLRQAPNWEKAFEDSQSVVFTRK
jgi:hypothetical protein